MKTLKMFFAICMMMLAGGCGLFWDDPYVTVTTSALNWAEIHYYNASREPIRRVSLRLNGMGTVNVKSGTSRRVSDSFAKTIADPTWNDMRTQEYHVDQEHIREIFQDLVNAGLFDREKMFRGTRYPSRGRFIAVRAAFDNKTFSEPENIFEADPELAERLLNVVQEFNRPFLARKPQTLPQKPEDKADEKK